jgi:hypothetical protein
VGRLKQIAFADQGKAISDKSKHLSFAIDAEKGLFMLRNEMASQAALTRMWR